jgi:hypothetical protein
MIPVRLPVRLMVPRLATAPFSWLRSEALPALTRPPFRMPALVNVALLATGPDRDPAEVRASVPALTVVSPVKLLSPARVKVPRPVLMRPPLP